MAKEYEFIECRDLRHSWRGQVTHIIWPVAKFKDRKGLRWRGLLGTHVLERRVACTSCGSVNIEYFSLVKSRTKAGFVVGQRITPSIKYTKGYLQQPGEHFTQSEFKLANVQKAIADGRAIVVTDKE